MSLTRNRLLATIALTGALGAALAGEPRRSSLDVDELARMVQREEDHLTAMELAALIRRRTGARIIDLRSKAEYDAVHIPGAERVALDTIARIPVAAHDTLVLYSEGGAHSAQAWVFLRAMGARHVFFLRGGISEWVDQVLSPSLPVDASDAERAEFARRSEMSVYFNGMPRTNVPRTERETVVRQIRRRGC